MIRTTLSGPSRLFAHMRFYCTSPCESERLQLPPSGTRALVLVSVPLLGIHDFVGHEHAADEQSFFPRRGGQEPVVRLRTVRHGL